MAIDPASKDTGCVLCDTGHKPLKIVQMKGRMYRPIPYSKHRSARILKKLMKRRQLDDSKSVIIINFKDMTIKELLKNKKSIFEGIVDEFSYHLKRRKNV